MFVPDTLKSNAFRVLRVSADATLSEIHKAAGAMRRAVALGLASTIEVDVPVLGDVPRTEADIRAALSRLENPTQRLTARLFWFRAAPESRTAEASSVTSEADRALLRHDEALRGLVAALGAGSDNSSLSLWTQAIRAWHEVVSDDAYWVNSLEIEQQGDFEPKAFPSEIDALRDEAVQLAAEPLIVSGRDALARDDSSTVRRILSAITGLTDTGPWAAIAAHDIAAPAVESFRRKCRAVHEELGSLIVREEQAGERNKSTCGAEMKRFRTEIEPGLNHLIQILPPNHQSVQESREEAALCLSAIATDYTWADDFIAAEKLRDEALRLAQDTLGVIRIQDGLEQIRDAAHKQRIFGELERFASPPMLGTLNGFGFTLYGSSDYDQQSSSYATTYYFTALFIPIFPIARYRVIDAGPRRYSFLGKLPLRTVHRWHLGIALTVIAAMIVLGAFSGSSSTVSSAASTSSYQVGAQSSQLSDLKARIDSGRLQMTQLKTQLQPVLDDLTRLSSQVKVIKTELDLLDEQQKAGIIQINVDDYNAKVKAHNALLAKQQALVTANKSDLDAYDDLVEQDSTLVKQYNALLK